MTCLFPASSDQNFAKLLFCWGLASVPQTCQNSVWCRRKAPISRNRWLFSMCAHKDFSMRGKTAAATYWLAASRKCLWSYLEQNVMFTGSYWQRNNILSVNILSFLPKTWIYLWAFGSGQGWGCLAFPVLLDFSISHHWLHRLGLGGVQPYPSWTATSRLQNSI